MVYKRYGRLAGYLLSLLCIVLINGCSDSGGGANISGDNNGHHASLPIGYKDIVIISDLTDTHNSQISARLVPDDVANMQCYCYNKYGAAIYSYRTERTNKAILHNVPLYAESISISYLDRTGKVVGFYSQKIDLNLNSNVYEINNPDWEDIGAVSNISHLRISPTSPSVKIGKPILFKVFADLTKDQQTYLQELGHVCSWASEKTDIADCSIIPYVFVGAKAGETKITASLGETSCSTVLEVTEPEGESEDSDEPEDSDDQDEPYDPDDPEPDDPDNSDEPTPPTDPLRETETDNQSSESNNQSEESNNQSEESNISSDESESDSDESVNDGNSNPSDFLNDLPIVNETINDYEKIITVYGNKGYINTQDMLDLHIASVPSMTYHQDYLYQDSETVWRGFFGRLRFTMGTTPKRQVKYGWDDPVYHDNSMNDLVLLAQTDDGSTPKYTTISWIGRDGTKHTKDIRGEIVNKWTGNDDVIHITYEYSDNGEIKRKELQIGPVQVKLFQPDTNYTIPEGSCIVCLGSYNLLTGYKINPDPTIATDEQRLIYNKLTWNKTNGFDGNGNTKYEDYNIEELLQLGAVQGTNSDFKKAINYGLVIPIYKKVEIPIKDGRLVTRGNNDDGIVDAFCVVTKYMDGERIGSYPFSSFNDLVDYISGTYSYNHDPHSAFVDELTYNNNGYDEHEYEFKIDAYCGHNSSLKSKNTITKSFKASLSYGQYKHIMKGKAYDESISAYNRSCTL